MKRDTDLIREILLTLEHHKHGMAPQEWTVDGYTDDQIGHHIWLMGQAGLLEIAETTHTGSDSPEAIAVTITWEGHEFLDAAKEPSRWEAAKRKIKTAGAAMTIDIIKEVLTSLSKQALHLP